MPVTEEKIIEAIYQGIDVVNGQLSERSRLVKSTDTVLMGDGGVLDSLGLITLLVAIEDAIQSNLGTHIIVLDEDALANSSGPYNTVESLMNWISSRA
jgi:D-alanine--poly(phosphoribitol) ligase subunit 2